MTYIVVTEDIKGGPALAHLGGSLVISKLAWIIHPH